MAPRRRIKRIMNQKGLVSAYTRKKYKPRAAKASEVEAPNVLDREFDGHPPHTRIVSDLAYVRVGGKWNYVCLLIDLRNREIVGHAASGRKDSRLVKAAFATLGFPPTGIEPANRILKKELVHRRASAASPTHASGGAAGRGCIRRWAT